MAAADIERAIRVSSERLWEWLRDLNDLYQVDTGDPDPLVLPPWSELSVSSQNLFVLACGMVVEPLFLVTSQMPEVT